MKPVHLLMVEINENNDGGDHPRKGIHRLIISWYNNNRLRQSLIFAKVELPPRVSE